MAATTTISGIRYPESTDQPDPATDMQNIASDVDTILIPRFADATARDAAITAPVDGQLCYLTSDNKLYTFRNSYGYWQAAIHSYMKMKTAKETLSASTTLQDDNHITGIPYKANTSYLIRGLFVVGSPAAADFKAGLTWSSAPVDGQWSLWGSEASNTMGARTAGLTSTIAPPTQGGSIVDFVTVQGYVKTHASTAGTVKLQWAQNTSDAGTTTVYMGTYIELIQA